MSTFLSTFPPALGRLLRFLVSYFRNVYSISAFIFTCTFFGFWFFGTCNGKSGRVGRLSDFSCLFYLFICLLRVERR